MKSIFIVRRPLAWCAGACLIVAALAGCEPANNDDAPVKGAASVEAAEPTVTLFNDDWHYLQNNAQDVAEISQSDKWQHVNIPHTWNATDTVDAEPGYRRNASWYKKEFSAGQASRYVLYFEGANMETQVYINDQLAGEHIGGYLGFDIELTPWLKKNAKNTLLVRVSNAYNPHLIPSQKADFFIHGGITRDVWLKALPETYIDRLQIDTPTVSESTAQTRVRALLNVGAASTQGLTLSAEVKSPDGSVVLSASNIEVAANNEVDIVFKDIANPQLWSVDTPNLYTMQVALRDSDNKIIHEVNEKFGYRWFEMRAGQGFFVNGKRMLIRGTHRHEESAGVGAALTNEMHRADMQQIKDMGANFVRLAHYPQDPEVYRAADELGLVLWDELPWCRGGKGGEEWEKNTESYLKRQIAQNRNHASIAFWSLGNEMYWEEDFPGGGNDDAVLAYVKKLNAIAKAADSSRLTTLRKFYPAAKVVDAFSPSIWAGWYGGAYGQYEEAIRAAMKDYPAFLHMEYGGSSHAGRHTETPTGKEGIIGAQVSVEEAMNQAVVKSVAKDSDWNENYMVDLFDWHLHVSESVEGFAGNAQWAMKDFGTPLRPENPIPYVNQKGLLDRNGNPKDAYYVFASYWSDKPFCYIESKTWTHRQGPKEGRDVTVYCNTHTAELFLNDKSLGVKQRDPQRFPAGGLVWKVPFKAGVNHLRVEGIIDDVKVHDKLDVTYLIGEHGKLDSIKLSAKPLDSGNILIEAEALDSDGNRVLNYSERAYFFNVGEQGQLIENQGTPNGSSIIEMASGYAAIEFIPGDKPSVIEFRNQNVKGVYLNVDAKQ
ncbi:glycoside hydrolase family 2 protein [Saccharophagus degradans]|uniref:Glycoside hydrolase family 2 TIM barrel-domain containing protein n=1 Tax=Saccharophagus degradans TaxID=86304 RepID=A0AAW7X976_9GAMM|nr:glycoside hydrolase family 2 TIM barrel-domain containing protein [Saccharophagus degradans]MDO6422997.1 glycoside hydrolase family 2 TIM barrel-domain containing protein [Saccharophagus degradans]MDO6607142.1 glycoside hydrolase family 2 TIM barrel-domain containing protein [Saccharophagus degradans]